MKIVRHCLVGLLLFTLGCAASPDRQPAPEPAPAPVVPAPPPPPPPNPRDFTATVHFDAASAEISAAGIRELEAFAGKLRPFPERSVHVAGYSEATDAEKADPWLSERRAKNVASFLVSQGIAIDHVTLRGLGAEPPAAGAPQSDRRLVEVTVR
jgi:OOP family OmpA-OmpF porin